MSYSVPASRSSRQCRIRSFCHLEGATIAAGAIVGPVARLRPARGARGEVHVGNFVEVKETRLGAGAKANHLSYLGDSEEGPPEQYRRRTITCNYDGFNKHQTIIGRDAFIGSNTALVAPGDGRRRGYVATGSVVTQRRAEGCADDRAGAGSISRGAPPKIAGEPARKESLSAAP
jgi:bifunctional UDP-N-acetylglucosamine pyrophosphorylase/glucosamine-1-phosphate N-acetyltransferase